MLVAINKRYLRAMNKTMAIIIGAVIILFGAGVYAIMSNNSDDINSSNSSQSTEDDHMEKEDDAMMKDDGHAMDSEEGSMMQESKTYVTLAEYEANKASYADKTKVYFFHASWCPTCQGIDKEINADPTKIPSSAVFIKTDFDEETTLRQKYGVTTQYTFVQVDNDGNEVAQWSASSLDKAIAGIQS